MVIQYLQVVEPPVLPSLQEIIKQKNVDNNDISVPHFLYGFDIKFFMNLKKLTNFFKKNNTMTIIELFKGFFHYYSNEFDYDKFTISVRNGKPILKKWDNIISIEDPFEIREYNFNL
jgi:DNA polymerase sigma